jgi:octaheme c-type cytochrome (tetrathionate reductase family)
MKNQWIPAVLAVSVLIVTAGCGGGGGSCPTCGPELPPPPSYVDHDDYFEDNLYVDATTCTQSGCHPSADNEVMATVHWNWEGSPNAIEGSQGSQEHGKADLLNNFCISIPSNEGRCTQCHVGYGWVNDDFDHSDASAIDCLVCHDQTGTYAKMKPNGGQPELNVDLQAVAMSTDKGMPGRRNCLECHKNAGGGDNIKHGDLSSSLYAATHETDVHMDLDGENMSCQRCHETANHEVAGQGLHYETEGSIDCSDCHGSSTLHADAGHSGTYDNHLDKVACQTCHIPTFARVNATKTQWYWATAGDKNRTPIVDPVTGKPDYNWMKGDFIWELNVEPEILWYDHEWSRMVIDQNDTWTTVPVVLAAPTANINTSGAKLYPFKKMIGSQPADIVNNRIISPHLFGSQGGPHPYWGILNVYAGLDWDLALQDGANYTGVPFTPGNGGFVDTVMYLTVNHEIAPHEQARQCISCHDTSAGLDWAGLGYSSNPFPMQPYVESHQRRRS